MNFAYCIDDNFNVQCAVSIHSLLKNVKNKISIHILHSTPSTFEKYLERLYKHKNCKEIILYPVNSERHKFPNLNNSHVSSATYFRLFLEDFLNEKEEIIYLDADTIVLNDPTDLITNQILDMQSGLHYFGASIETNKQLSQDIFERLELSGKNYFNAGVMIFDFRNPKLRNLSEELLVLTQKIKDKIKQWDQDVLNKYFDNNFFNIDENLNFRLYDHGNLPNQDVKILHYLGSTKPWTFEGLKINNSKFYQDNYKELFNKSLYHVNSKWKKKTYLELLIYVISLKIFRHKDPFKIFLSTIKLKKN